MQNCFQKMNCFYWTSLISVLINLKHWYYDSPYPELPTILIMFFIGFSILSYPIQRNATTSIGYTKPYGKPSQSNLLLSCLRSLYYQAHYPSKIYVFESRFSFKVRQLGQQQLYFQYQVCLILYEMIVVPSFSQPYLWIKSPLQSPPKILSSTSVNFHLTFQSLLFNKTILKILTNTPFLHTAAFFHLAVFAYNNGSNLHQKYFPCLSDLANLGCVKGERSYGLLRGFLTSLFFLKVWTVIATLTVTGSLSLRLIKWLYCM